MYNVILEIINNPIGVVKGMIYSSHETEDEALASLNEAYRAISSANKRIDGNYFAIGLPAGIYVRGQVIS